MAKPCRLPGNRPSPPPPSVPLTASCWSDGQVPPLRSVPSLGPGAAPVGRADGGSRQGPPSSISDFTLAEGSSFSSNACLSHILLWKHRAEKGRGFQSQARRQRNPVMGLVAQSPGGPLPAGHHTGLEEWAERVRLMPRGEGEAEHGTRGREVGCLGHQPRLVLGRSDGSALCHLTLIGVKRL